MSPEMGVGICWAASHSDSNEYKQLDSRHLLTNHPGCLLCSSSVQSPKKVMVTSRWQLQVPLPQKYKSAASPLSAQYKFVGF
jgi:hypothetical protein